LREGATDDDLRVAILAVWAERDDRYSELRSADTKGLKKIEMSFIGG
jgi:cyclic pyranopterin phosphate synthase